MVVVIGILLFLAFIAWSRWRLKSNRPPAEHEQSTFSLDRFAGPFSTQPYVPPPAPRWQSNVPFTDFVQVLSHRLEHHLPVARHDREKLALKAGLSLTTVEKMLRGETNATLHSLYLLCQARQIPLSCLFGEVESSLQQTAALEAPSAVNQT